MQRHELGYEGPLWCWKESTHLRMSQRGMMEILFMKKKLKVFANAAIEE